MNTPVSRRSVTVWLLVLALGVAAWSWIGPAPAVTLELNLLLAALLLAFVAGLVTRAVVVDRPDLFASLAIRRGDGIDPLTGVATRRAFLNAAQSALENALRGPNYSLLVVDLDGLKDINDSFSHATGDAALRRLAATLLHCTPTGDLVGRLSGDELAVLARHTAGVTEETIVARYLEPLRAMLYQDDAGRSLLLSASWGIATTTAGRWDVTALLVAADDDLRRRKVTASPVEQQGGPGEAAFVPRGRRALASALNTLMDAARELVEATSAEDFLRRAAVRAAELIGTERATVSVTLAGPEHSPIHAEDCSTCMGFRATRTAGGWQVARAGSHPGRSSIVGYVRETGQPYFSNDLTADPLVNRGAARALGALNCLCVPLRDARGQVCGTFFLMNKLGRAPFNEQDLHLTQAFADLAAVALEKNRPAAVPALVGG